MVQRTMNKLDFAYLLTPTGQLNLAEIFCLIGALISVAFTSSLFCELADRFRVIYADLNTHAVRSIFQTFSIITFAISIVILLIHIYGIRYSSRRFLRVNQLCMIVNILTGLMMISIGICAAFWEDKLRRTPGIIRRGYFSNEYQVVFGELVHPRPGAAAAAATFAILAGVLLLIDAVTRHLKNDGTVLVPTELNSVPTRKNQGERIIPIEKVVSQPTA